MTKIMMETEAVGADQSPGGAPKKAPDAILANLPADVKEIRALRSERHIPVVDIVEVVASIYPKFDRYLLSKVEHGEEYGIRLRADAQKELMTHFKIHPEDTGTKRKPNRTKPMRVSCRLTEKAYRLLQRELERTGKTMQSWLEGLIFQELMKGDSNGRVQ